MKRLLVLLVAGVALLAVPAAMADGPDPVVTVQQGGMTFFYDTTAQTYAQVPDYATGAWLGINWNGTSWTYAVPVLTTGQLAAPTGTALASVWAPIQTAELPDGSVYMLGTDGAYHYLTSPSTAFAHGLTWTGTDWAGVTHVSSMLELTAPVGAAYTG